MTWLICQNNFSGVGHGNGNDITMEVWANRKCVYRSKFRKRNNCILTHNKEKDCLDIQFEYCPVLVDDIKVRFCSKAVGSLFHTFSQVLRFRMLLKPGNNMSRVVRKPAFCTCENKDADQLRGNREADQRLCFRHTDSTIPLLPKSKISSLYPSSVAVQTGLCQTWSETPKTGFLRMRLIFKCLGVLDRISWVYILLIFFPSTPDKEI